MPSEFVWREKNEFAPKQGKDNLKKIIQNINSKCSLRSIFQFYSLSFEYNPSQSGWNEKACCPFSDHKDDTASFYYHSDKNIFYCFGCQKSGGPVQFVNFFAGLSLLKSAQIILQQNFPIHETNIKFSLDAEKEKEIVFLLRDFSCRVQQKINLQSVDQIEKFNWILQCYLRHKQKLSMLEPSDLQILIDKIEYYIDK